MNAVRVRCGGGSAMALKGLICAGGEATRLGELTQITNKHLLPVGRWPMVYYALELLQMASINEVLIVTGHHHGGDFMRLLGDGQKRGRADDHLLFDLDLTYKVQTHPGGIAQVVGMAERFAAGDKLVVCLADNIFQYAPLDGIMRFDKEQATGAKIFLKEVPDPERFGVPVFNNGRLVDIAEKPGTVDLRFTEPPSPYAIPGLYCYDPDVYDIVRSLKPSLRGELEIADVNRAYIERGNMTYEIIRGWWRDAGTHAALSEIGTLVNDGGANLVDVDRTPHKGPSFPRE